ncbi:MAG TPA: DNRLRE domain-containing protein [Vicinamibacteria bacterium]
MGLGLAVPGGADTLPVKADGQVNLTSVALKGGILTTTTVKNTLPGAAVRAFARFDLTALPSGLPVTKATLRIWPNLVTTEGNIEVSAVLGAWDEPTLAAIVAPALSDPVVDFTVLKSDLKTYVHVDITELVKDWVDGDLDNHGIALVGQATRPVNARFDTKENTTTSHPMELEVMLGLPAGSGDITAIRSGPGLIGGGNLGDITLSVDTTFIQRRVAKDCPAGSSIRLIDAAGNVTCQGGDVTGVAAGFGLSGGGTAGDVALAANPAILQQRVIGTCAVGSSIRAIDSAGNVTCEPDAGIAAQRIENQSTSTTVTSTNKFLCRTSPYTAASGDRAFVWVTASCEVPSGQAISANVGYNAGTGDVAAGTQMPASAAGGGGEGRYTHTNHMYTLALTAGSTYTFTTAIRNPFSTASWAATCYCNTLVQIAR